MKLIGSLLLLLSFTLAHSQNLYLKNVRIFDGKSNEITDGQAIKIKGRTIEWIGNHVISKLRIGTHGAVALTTQGEVILIFHQYISHTRGPSIHSSLQLENNRITVDDSQQP